MKAVTRFIGALSGALLAPFVVAGCSQEAGVIESGITAALAAAPARTPGARAAVSEDPAAKHGGPTHKTFRRSDGMRIDLEQGLLALSVVRLEPCGTAARRLERWLPWGTAHAHAGHDHGEPPEGVLDVVGQADGQTLSLGTLAAAPGDYCAVRVRVAPAVVRSAKHGEALDTDMNGKSLRVAPCHYPQSVGLPALFDRLPQPHRCQALALSLAGEISLLLEQSLRLDAAQRSVNLRLAVHYDQWFDDLDMDRLGADAAEQQRLLRNVLGSLTAGPALR